MKRLKQVIKPILVTTLITIVALVSVLSRAMAEVDELGPSELTTGEYTNQNQPAFEFLLEEDAQELPLRYRVEVVTTATGFDLPPQDAPRLISYTSGEVEELGPFNFTVGQAPGVDEGSYAPSQGSEDQVLADGAYYWRVGTVEFNEGTPDYEDYIWETANDGDVAFIVDTTGPEFSASLTSPSHTPSVWSDDSDIEVAWLTAQDPDAGSEPGSGLAGYYYVFDTNNATDPDDSDDELDFEETSITIDDVEDGNSYYFHIRAFDELGNLGETEHIGPFWIDSTSPTAPGLPTAGTEYVSSDSPEITWTASNFDISGAASPAYSVEYAQNDEFIDSEFDNSNVNALILSGLADGTWYLRVVAYDAAGNESEPSEVASFIVDTQEPEISNVEAQPQSDTVIINWDTDELASSVVEYGITDDYDEDQDLEGYTDEHTVEISNLLECTTYFYLVRSVDQAGNSIESGGHSFTTTGCVGASPVLDQTQETISEADGGSVELTEEDLGIELNIPPGFSGEDAVFQIKKLDVGSVNTQTSSPENFAWIGNYVYDLKALTDIDVSMTEFDESIQITIYFEEEDIEGIELSTVQIFRWNGSEWNPLDSCLIDEVGFAVTCQTTNFSVFGLFGEGESPEPPAPTPTPTPKPSSSDSASLGTSTPTVPLCGAVKPSGVPDLFQIDTTNNQAVLYFSPTTSNVNKYAVVYGHESGQELFGAEFDHGESGGVVSYRIDHLNPNTTYYFKVRAGNGCMPGEWSNEMRITTGRNNVTTKFYKNFVQQIVSSLPRLTGSGFPVIELQTVGSSPSPMVNESGGSEAESDDFTQPTQEETLIPPATDSPSENNENGSGFWSWLKSLFGM